MYVLLFQFYTLFDHSLCTHPICIQSKNSLYVCLKHVEHHCKTLWAALAEMNSMQNAQLV